MLPKRRAQSGHVAWLFRANMSCQAMTTASNSAQDCGLAQQYAGCRAAMLPYVAFYFLRCQA